MRIVIETISHNQQRYPTVGDYYTHPDGEHHIKVSHLANQDYEFLVALHELVEMWLCKKAGITDAEITAFDTAFEALREEGDTAEPGDDPAAPYQRQHCIATGIERLICAELDIKWADYDKACACAS